MLLPTPEVSLKRLKMANWVLQGRRASPNRGAIEPSLCHFSCWARSGVSSCGSYRAANTTTVVDDFLVAKGSSMYHSVTSLSYAN